MTPTAEVSAFSADVAVCSVTQLVELRAFASSVATSASSAVRPSLWAYQPRDAERGLTTGSSDGFLDLSDLLANLGRASRGHFAGRSDAFLVTLGDERERLLGEGVDEEDRLLAESASAVISTVPSSGLAATVSLFVSSSTGPS